MFKRKLFYSAGFTLVELSIVLVIIGLLIGGILVARSMISTAKVQSFVRQIGQFDTAIENFRTRYNSLPGDSSVMGCTVVGENICDNGQIEDELFLSSGSYADTFSAETANFWPQLQMSGFTAPGGASFTPTITTKFSVKAPSPNAPQMPIGSNTSAVVVTLDPAVIGNPAVLSVDYTAYQICNYGNSIGVTDSTISLSGMGCSYDLEIPVADALAIDTKMDNGLANTVNSGANINNEIVSAHMQMTGVPESCTEDEINYNVDNSSAKCDLFVQILFQTGGAR